MRSASSRRPFLRASCACRTANHATSSIAPRFQKAEDRCRGTKGGQKQQGLEQNGRCGALELPLLPAPLQAKALLESFQDSKGEGARPAGQRPPLGDPYLPAT